MDKYLTVELLKQGDKFEFLTARLAGAKPAVMVVTRNPAVNSAANSCHFRYQPDDASHDASARWNENQSWNGTPGVKVLLIEKSAPSEPIAVIDPAAVVPRAKPAKPAARRKRTTTED